MTVIDVVQALELLEVCAAEMAGAGSSDGGDTGAARRSRTTLAERALAKRQLRVDDLVTLPGRASRSAPTDPDAQPMTLGALIVFRTAYRSGRAGASAECTLAAAYRATERYAELIATTFVDGRPNLDQVRGVHASSME
jgi:hypothetical protein